MGVFDQHDFITFFMHIFIYYLSINNATRIFLVMFCKVSYQKKTGPQKRTSKTVKCATGDLRRDGMLGTAGISLPR